MSDHPRVRFGIITCGSKQLPLPYASWWDFLIPSVSFMRIFMSLSSRRVETNKKLETISGRDISGMVIIIILNLSRAMLKLPQNKSQMETDEILSTQWHGNKQNGEEGPGTISFSPTLMHGSATGTYEDPSKKKQGRSVSLIILIQPLESFFLPVLGFCHSI